MGTTARPDHAAPDGPVSARRELRLRPDSTAATWWSILGVVLVGMGSFYVVDTRGHPIALVTALFFAIVAGYFVVQVVSPELMAIDLDQDGIRARTLWWRTEIPWESVHLARVDKAMGEPYLELHVRERAPWGDPWQTRAVALLLPVGADVPALHEFLAARLGRGV